MRHICGHQYNSLEIKRVDSSILFDEYLIWKYNEKIKGINYCVCFTCWRKKRIDGVD